jgi:proteic killer suppression protein
MIKTFRDRRTVALFEGRFVKGIDRRLIGPARRKLRMIHAASSLEELAVVPGNHLEAMQRDRKGQHSIRINRQWRLCFAWRDGDAYDVEFTDYH